MVEARRSKLLARAGRLAGAVGIAAATVVVPAVGSAQAAGGLIISEVAPWASGNSPYAVDWFEVTNTSGSAISITGWKVDDSSNAFASAVALSGISSIASGESVIFMETGTPAATVALFTSAWFGAGAPAGLQLGSYSGSGIGLSTGGDAVVLFDASGAVRASVTFGASPAAAPFATFDNAAGIDAAAISTLSVAGVNGATLVASSPAAIGSPGTIVNSSTPTTTTTGPTTTAAPTTTVAPAAPWPGSQTVTNASSYTFGGNMSGLVEEASGTAARGVLWGVRNGPGALFRLVWNGTAWTPDSANDWSAGKLLRYPSGTGDPDAEGVTVDGSGPAGGIYVATERNNAANTVSRNAILRFDPTAAGTSLTANAEWNLTADLPATGANLGLEAITWVPDTYLVAAAFRDDHLAKPYAPADYPNHGTGLFLVGVEGTGMVHAYALDQAGTAFTRVASFSSSFTAVMDLQFDPELQQLWAVCDNTCNGRHAVLRVNPSTGAFAVVSTYERPTGMPNYNNEGFAVAPTAECVNGRKPAYWANDGEDLGVAIRAGDVPCAAAITPPVDVPEFPVVVLPGVLALGGFVVAARRRRPALAA